MGKNKDFQPDQGNIIESLYAGVEQSKKQPLKKTPPKPIKSLDDLPKKNKLKSK